MRFPSPRSFRCLRFLSNAENVNAKIISLNKEAHIKAVQERLDKIPISRFRNFSIVAHVDHGKSTLSDRLLELTGVIQPGSKKQVLDKLDVERERGITVKAQTCTMFYTDAQGVDYLLHLVDTPGHVDFRAEVLRSYALCGGALLIVDASQGVQAQTVANFYLAYSMGLKLVPVINKIDLDAADIPSAMDQIESTFELDSNLCIPVSAKTGLNVAKILPSIVEHIPPPDGDSEKPLRLLLVDSWHDPYVGVVMLVYVKDGVLRKRMKLVSAHSGRRYEVKDTGIMYPDKLPLDSVRAGQVAYVVLGMKNPNEAMIGDTYFQLGVEGVEPLPGFEEPKPMVFVGAFPADGGEFKAMNDQIENLVLNDRSVTLQKETSVALGLGWRLGFLGSLHASVFKERLEKEYGAKIILTAPTVPYKICYKDGSERIINNPNEFPDLTQRAHNVSALMEPFVNAIMTIPSEYMGTVMSLCEGNRGIQQDVEYLNTGQVLLRYEIPLAQLVEDFFGKLKGSTKGYASLDYEDAGYRVSDIVKMDLCVSGDPQDALAQVMHKSQVQFRGREYVSRFKELLRFQLFDVAIQAKVGNKIVARETIKAKRKDVTQRLHAADISRRKKLLERQKEGKRQMKAAGLVHIDHQTFQAFLRRE